MSDVVVLDAGDRFRPRKPAATKDVEIQVAADVNIMLEIENFVACRRQLTEHVAKPLFPEVRAKMLAIHAIVKDQPGGV